MHDLRQWQAFGGGTDFVMCGGMFAGTDEAAGQVAETYWEVDRWVDGGDGWMGEWMGG